MKLIRLGATHQPFAPSVPQAVAGEQSPSGAPVYVLLIETYCIRDRLRPRLHFRAVRLPLAVDPLHTQGPTPKTRTRRRGSASSCSHHFCVDAPLVRQATKGPYELTRRLGNQNRLSRIWSTLHRSDTEPARVGACAKAGAWRARGVGRRRRLPMDAVWRDRGHLRIRGSRVSATLSGSGSTQNDERRSAVSRERRAWSSELDDQSFGTTGSLSKARKWMPRKSPVAGSTLPCGSPTAMKV